MSDQDFKPAESISEEAKKFFQETFSRAGRDAMRYPEIEDLEGWKRYNREALAERRGFNEELIKRYRPSLSSDEIAGIQVLDVRPEGWKDNGKVIVYTHGGGYVGGTADDALDSILPFCDETGLRAVSITYTLAPHAQFKQVTDETVSVLLGLFKQGYAPQDIAIFGDSAGGGLAASTVLKLRDLHSILPACVLLWSPWGDLSGSGDSYSTMAVDEPFFTYENFLGKAALAYAGPGALTHPYASPVFGDYTKGYPPTLIQAGTRELLLSDSVRLYRAMARAGLDASLEIYEGMWHVFQFKGIDMPEAIEARRKSAQFLMDRLQLSTRMDIPALA